MAQVTVSQKGYCIMGKGTEKGNQRDQLKHIPAINN